MPDLIKTSLGVFTAPGIGFAIQGQAGTHQATVTVQGAASVAASVTIRGSNDQLAWTDIGTASPSGTGVATATVSWSNDYLFWRADVASMTGERLQVSVASDQTGGGSSPGGSGSVAVQPLLDASVQKRLLRFAGTRYKCPQQMNAHSGTAIYALHESVFVSPDYIVSNPRFFLPAFAATGALSPVDRYAESQITYYGLAIKVGSTWYKIKDSTDPTKGLDFLNGTVVGPAAVGTAASTGTSGACTLTLSAQPKVGDVAVFNNAGTRTFAVVETVAANSTNWDITATTISSGGSVTSTAQSIPSACPVTICREPGLLSAPIPVNIPAGSTVRVQLLYAAPSSTTAVPGQTVSASGHVPTLTKLDVERVTAAADRGTTVPSGCNGTLNAMYGTDLLNTSSNPQHSGMYASNTNIKRIHAPAFVVAQGGDGRPVALIAGDSIAYGSDDECQTIYNANYSQGYLERGLDENTATKRLSYGVIAEKGTSQYKYTNPLWWKPRLDALQMIRDMNGGLWPFDLMFEESGANATGDTQSMTRMASMLSVFKNYFNSPIIGVEILPKPGSSDGFQSLAGQTVSPSGTQYPTGYLWQMNIGKGGADGLGDPNATWRAAGLLDGSFAPWRYVSYDTGSNRDKVKVRPFTATLASALTAGTYTYQLSVTAGDPPKVGETLIIDPTGSPQTIIIDGVTDNGGGSYTLTGYPTGFGATTAAAAGVTCSIAHLGLFSGTALHPSPWAAENLLKQALVDWKVAYGLSR